MKMAKSRDIETENHGDFQSLVNAIADVHIKSNRHVKQAVNTALTLRNWLIGSYIREYEQKGEDRAAYGDKLLEKLSHALRKNLDKAYTGRYLGLCRQLFDAYPQIRKSVISEFKVSDLFLASREIQKSTISEFELDAETLLQKLSFTHLVELISIDNPLKRAFYEIECIRGNWSVRELKRQVATLYFERSGLSEDPEKLSEIVNSGIEQENPRLDIRDPYVFEFLGLRSKDAVMESDLEAALVAHLREFLLELGNGFCLEAQQKSIVIGNTRGFVDLVFYHRVLKCHILIELKVDAFTHEHIGQLNTYVSWYRKNMMEPGDNPPIGLLLCTQKDHALVEYALSAVDNKLFVSKYQLELPKEEELQRFLEEKRKEIGEQ
jgi:predicted nuclease of restriction endonuclease-like (RecB) superfamily